MGRVQKARGHSSALNICVKYSLRLQRTRQEQEGMEIQEVENVVQVFGNILDDVAYGPARPLKAEVLACRQ